ncbi:hypothetical protein tb265_49340 [Gemmatimonadetes bacterium T265]|nr:hypothetical protein tb265_49340 [Gemmatimonadetes bacterium T265]
MTPEPSDPEARGGTAVDPAAAPIPSALARDAHDAYAAAARWTGIRLRQAQHDGADVLAAYHAGYLEGLRDAAAGQVPPSDTRSDEATSADDDDGATGPAGAGGEVSPTRAAAVERARAEGYADGLRWRDPARRGGLVRLMLFLTGKPARRFAAEDLMRSPRRVRRMIAYGDVVEDVIRDELLRRLGALKLPD